MGRKNIFAYMHKYIVCLTFPAPGRGGGRCTSTNFWEGDSERNEKNGHK